jgi:hypothetical protein
MKSNDFGSRQSAYEEACKRAQSKAGLDPVPWKSILMRSTTIDGLAALIREHTMRNLPTMETMHYKNPEYVIQWAVDNENLAKQVETSPDLHTARSFIIEGVGTHKLG